MLRIWIWRVFVLMVMHERHGLLHNVGVKRADWEERLRNRKSLYKSGILVVQWDHGDWKCRGRFLRKN